jgi:phenylpyruvate tautomerase PptA (4-oxalocrotonate tautomerase family)
MPYCHLSINTKLTVEQKHKITQSITNACQSIANKSPRYVMVEISDDSYIVINYDEPAAYLGIHAIDLANDTIKELGHYLAREIADITLLNLSAIYVNVRSTPRSDWTLNPSKE